MSASEARRARAERAAALGLVGRCTACGELWPSCTCGRPIRPTTPLVEWVSWQVGRHLWQRSKYHVRMSSRGVLLCGRHSPETSPATITPPSDELCRVCVSKLPELAARSGLG